MLKDNPAMRSPLAALSDRIGIYHPRVTECDTTAKAGHQTPEDVREEIERIFGDYKEE